MHEHSGFKTHNQKMAKIQWYHLSQGSTKRNIGPRVDALTIHGPAKKSKREKEIGRPWIPDVSYSLK